MAVGTAETVIVSAMTSPTPGYLPVPFYGEDVTGGGSQARLTTLAAGCDHVSTRRALRMVSAARTLVTRVDRHKSRSLGFRRLIPPDCAAVAVVGVQIRVPVDSELRHWC